MSTLASAAHAQGQPQQQNHSIHTHHDHSAAGFSDLDSALYNVLADSNAGANPYGEYDESAGMDSGHVGGSDGGYVTAQPGNVFTWPYEQHGIPDMLSNFQGLPDQQHNTIRVEQARNGAGAGASGGLTSSGFNGGQGTTKTDAQNSLDPQLHVTKSSRLGRKTQHQATEPSDVSSLPPPSQRSQSKASTPLETERPSKANTHSSTRTVPDRSSMRSRSDFRPKTSIPTDLAPEDYARQCILAAYSSRLNPFALHPEEYELLRNHISQLQVTSYLNIRNGILRLWTRNPLVSVTREEASGCAKDYRWFDAADVAYEWLVRRGYINFGCLEVPDTTGTLAKVRAKRKTIVVVGAGMAGLGCARQLQGLFAQFGERFTAKGEEIPKVVVLEGRGRIGGRVYSHPLRTQSPENLPPGLRCTADMGAQIITGFDSGNPLSIVIRGQLALHYHPIRDNSILYDSDGSIIDKERDGLLENLFNDILDRASVYRHKIPQPQTIEGDRELIEIGRDPSGEGGKVIAMVQNPPDSVLQTGSTAGSSTRNGDTEMVPAGLDKLTGKAHIVPGSSSKTPATTQAVALGLPLREGVSPSRTLDLDTVVESLEHPTLGAVMDEALRQYQGIVDLTPRDMRLLNWHYANLEYANAANLHDLSLGGWDQDIGNEFEGEHAEIIGGYLQVPRGIWQCPTRLDVRKQCVVKRISYAPGDVESDAGKAIIDCDNGITVEADAVVVTLPLGVLKEKSVSFEPALPEWKVGPIERLGFGTLNKVGGSSSISP
jgi:Flavin containing amine oxidoreductase/SWIRM domain